MIEEIATSSLAVGAVVGYFIAVGGQRAARMRLEAQLASRATELIEARANAAQSKSDYDVLHGRHLAEQENLTHERTLVRDFETKLAGSFAQLSATALHQNSDAFLKLAQTALGSVTEQAKGDLTLRQHAIATSLAPITTQLETLARHLSELENKRGTAYTELSTQVKSLQSEQARLIESNTGLRTETARLVSSLRSSSVRGRWGEVQLRNVIELAGMVDHCDFHEQRSFTGDDGGTQRPDITVRLPSDNYIAVDAKVPLAAYLDAVDAQTDDERQRYLQKHAAAVRTHCVALSKKAYWQQLGRAPEFVVLFLPGEMFFSAALQADQTLLDYSWEQNVILATPTMLIALLKTIVHGWRAAELEKNAIEVQKIGLALYGSLKTMGDHIARLAKNLSGSVEAYNDFAGSFERNVYAKARRFSELKVVSEEINELPLIDDHPRRVTKVPSLDEHEIRRIQ